MLCFTTLNLGENYKKLSLLIVNSSKEVCRAGVFLSGRKKQVCREYELGTSV